MANATYDGMWNEAMGELNEQLHVEGVYDLGEGIMVDNEIIAAPNEVPTVNIYQAFQHFACLYIKYLQIFRKLESCYDNMLHPQKRILVKKVLELVIRRVLELKSELVKWNPLYSYKNAEGVDQSFPWEYVDLDELLKVLKLSSDSLEIPIPKYFKEDNALQIEQRDRYVSGYMKQKHGTDDLYIPDPYDSATTVEVMTIDRAIDIIQRNERGRQGFERAMLVKDKREKERQGRLYEASTKIEMDRDIAATHIQRMMKGFKSQNEAKKERENELMFIGMTTRKDNVQVLSYELNMAHVKRKQEQLENKLAYEQALEDLKEIILEEEGPEKRDQFREERTLWMTDQIAQDKFPENLEGFYNKDLDKPISRQSDDKKGSKSRGGSAKKSSKDDSKKGSKKDDKSKKNSKTKKQEPSMPKLQGKTELTENMAKQVDEFENVWENKVEYDNFQQKHDIELAKAIVRPNVFLILRKEVDKMLEMNLEQIKKQLDTNKKKKKDKKKKKKSKAKKSSKKSKSKGQDGDLDADQALSLLIEYKLVVRYRNKNVSSLIGDFNYLGNINQYDNKSSDNNALSNKKIDTIDPQDPSIAQLRQLITEYCILPNGSKDIKTAIHTNISDISIDNIKYPLPINYNSFLFYGPSGSGKTLAVEAIANELGALVIHLSPSKLKGLLPTKSGPSKLVNIIKTVARDESWQPCIIYFDECESIFNNKKGNKEKENFNKYKKEFQKFKLSEYDNEKNYRKIIKSNETTKKDKKPLPQLNRILFIGTTNNTDNDVISEYKIFFDKFLYFPYPNYSSSLLIWKKSIETQLINSFKKLDNFWLDLNNKKPLEICNQEETLRLKVSNIILNKLDLSSIAYVSEGYSTGAIIRAVKSIVTYRRVAMLRQRPLTNADFIDNLSLQNVSYQDDKIAFLHFTKYITKLYDRSKIINSLLSNEVGEKKKGKAKPKAKPKAK